MSASTRQALEAQRDQARVAEYEAKTAAINAARTDPTNTDEVYAKLVDWRKAERKRRRLQRQLDRMNKQNWGCTT